MTVYGPTVTSRGKLGLRRNDGAWIDAAHAGGRLCRSLVGFGRDHHFRRSYLIVAHVGDGGELPDAAHGALELGGEDELIARLDRLAKARLVDADEEEPRGIVRHHVGRDEGQQAGGLRQRLDDHDARHHRTMREVPGKERLVGGDVLDRPDALALDALQHAVDQQEWIAMRQQAPDAHDGRVKSTRSFS